MVGVRQQSSTRMLSRGMRDQQPAPSNPNPCRPEEGACGNLEDINALGKHIMGLAGNRKKRVNATYIARLKGTTLEQVDISLLLFR
jgi:hypothetical protein